LSSRKLLSIREQSSFLPVNVSSQKRGMLSVVWVPKAREQNGVANPTELRHVGEHLVAQMTVPGPVGHHRTRRVEALQVVWPLTGVTDEHVSIAFGCTTDGTRFPRDLLHGCRAPKLHEI
jgi:hypothetical protein